MDKARAYKFDAKVSRMYYYRFLPIIALGQHNYDLRRQISEFNLKLFPQRAVRFNLGYGRSMSVGPYATTYDYERDEFPINGRSRWESNDYRAGVDATYKGWNFFIEGFYRKYKLDTTFDQNPGTNIGNNTTNTSILTFFTRDEPNRSRAVIGRGSIQGNITSRIHLLVRGMRGDEFLNSRLFEPTAGTDASRRTILSRNIVGEGNAKRPSANFDAGVTFDVSDTVAINNTFRYTFYRILGDLNLSTASRLRATNGTVTDTTVSSFDNRYTDVTSYWNTVDVRYAPNRKFALNAGWRATRRNIELQRPGLTEDDTLTTNTGIFGMRIRPIDRLNLFFDYENGTADNIFVRTNALDFQRVRARVNVQATDTLSFSGTISTTDNKNPTPFVENESDFRSYSISANWEPSSRLWVTGGYNYDDLFSQANIFFFLNRVETSGRSVFYSRQNFFFADSRFGVTKFLDLFLVYRYVQDGGAPSSAAGSFTGANDFVASYPLRRHNPEARIAVHLSNHVTANVSYRHFSYNEKALDFQDYRANIVTSSVRFTF
ncbi:MAG: hypothetical protein IPM55_14655 [Acidobacteria bacterium]|nr:hypothetical protein [Acidobacteriota bacterium]